MFCFSEALGHKKDQKRNWHTTCSSHLLSWLLWRKTHEFVWWIRVQKGRERTYCYSESMHHYISISSLPKKTSRIWRTQPCQDFGTCCLFPRRKKNLWILLFFLKDHDVAEAWWRQGCLHQDLQGQGLTAVQYHSMTRRVSGFHRILGIDLFTFQHLPVRMSTKPKKTCWMDTLQHNHLAPFNWKVQVHVVDGQIMGPTSHNLTLSEKSRFVNYCNLTWHNFGQI